MWKKKCGEDCEILGTDNSDAIDFCLNSLLSKLNYGQHQEEAGNNKRKCYMEHYAIPSRCSFI